MNYLVLDLETANSDSASICQIGIVQVERGEIVRTLSRLINPEVRFDPWNIKIHGILPEHVEECPTFPGIWSEIAPLIEGRTIVTHGCFDRMAIAHACEKHGLPAIRAHWLDNQTVVRRTWPKFSKRGYSLGHLARHFGITFRHHDALEDAVATAHIFRRALDASGRTASDWLASLSSQGSRRPAVIKQGSLEGAFFGKTVVFTGQMRVVRSEAVRLAAEKGFSVGTAMSPTTSMLCVGREGAAIGKSSKQREAERLMADGHPVSILSEDEFWRLLSG